MSSQERFQSDPLWESFKLTVTGAVRTAPLWILAGVLSAGVMSVLLNTREVDPPSAVVQLGLTDQVVWPFYDVVLNESLARVGAAETEVQDALGDSFISYEAALPEGRAVVEVVIVAETADDAERGARIMADLVMTASLDLLNEGLTGRQVVFRTTESEAAEDLDKIASEIAATTAQFTPGIGEAARRSLDQQLQVLYTEQDSTQRAQLEARNKANQLGQELELAKSEIEVSNITVTTPEESSSSFAPLAAAGLGVAILAAVGLTTWSLEHGRIRSEAQLRTVLDIPIVPFPTAPHDSIPLARKLRTLQKAGAQLVGLSSIPSSPDVVHELATSLKAVGANLLVTEFEADELTYDSLSLSGLDPDSNFSLSCHLECEAAFVVVDPQEASLRELRQRITDLTSLGLPVQGVILR
jgi:hypothetical protein